MPFQAGEISNWFPLLRGRTGIEAITKTTPVVLRLYCGPIKRVTIRTRVKSRRGSEGLLFGVKSVVLTHRKFTGWRCTKLTISLDFPLLDDLETDSRTDGFDTPQGGGTLTLIPTDGYLMKIYNED